MTEKTDAELIVESADAASAFGPIFDRHATTIHRFLARRVGPEDANDLLGEVFRIAFEHRASYDSRRPLCRPWLYGIANNVISHHRRSEERRLRATARLLAQRTASGDEAIDRVADAVDSVSATAAVVDAIADLPDGERDALLLVAWEGLNYREVADALAIPVGTVRSRLNRARAGCTVCSRSRSNTAQTACSRSTPLTPRCSLRRRSNS